MKYKQILNCLMVLAVIVSFVPQNTHAQTSAVRTIIFPVIGAVTYYDDFGNARVGHTHEGNDLMGKKMMPLVAAVDGTIINVNYPEESWGYSVTIRDKDDYTYHYLHMNNDTPGTDDGGGDGMNAYAPDVKQGNKVVKGQLIGYMGDSGNAETTQAHLHFEIRQPDHQAYSPYQSLQNATKITTPVTDYPKLSNELLPYENFGGGANVAAGNLDKDTAIEYVTGAGPGGGPLVKVLEKDGKVDNQFYAYGENFRGGVDVAVGDIDDNGVAEIITSPGPGGGPHIKVFKADGTLVKEFFAYAENFHGGVRVSASDIDSDDNWEVVTVPASAGGPHVKIWDAEKGIVIKELMAYDTNLGTGLDVAGFKGGFVTVPSTGGSPQVRVFDKSAQLKKEFFAYDMALTFGLRISVGDASSTKTGPEIIVAPASGGGPHVKMFSLTGSEVFSKLVAFESWWRGGYDVAAFKGGAIITSMGGRRTSLRSVTLTTTRTRSR